MIPSLRLAVAEVEWTLAQRPAVAPAAAEKRWKRQPEAWETRRLPLPRRATMAEMALVLILLALVVEAALVPSVETALVVPLQVSAVMAVLVVLHRLRARP